MNWQGTLKSLWGKRAKKPKHKTVITDHDTKQASDSQTGTVSVSPTDSHPEEDYSQYVGSDQPHISDLYRSTQYDTKQNNKSDGEVRIGLDFGTAFTKVVLGTSMGVFAVPLAKDLYTESENQYLLAGHLSIEKNGRCHLGLIDGCDQVDNLKMKIIDSEGKLDTESRAQVAAFLALLFRKIRWWWIDQDGAPAELRSEKIRWVVNGGLPTESMEGPTEQLYRHIILTAWAASVNDGEVNLHKISEACELSVKDKKKILQDDKGQKEYLMDSSLELIPEFLAQTAVYITNPKIEKLRLHAMIDIGAGTVDMTIFNVYEREGVIRHAIYGKKVIPFGVNYLINNRMKDLDVDMDVVSRSYLTSYTDQQFANHVRVDVGRIKDRDEAFTNKLAIHFSDLRNEVRTNQNISTDINLLQRGIKLFLAGGGSRVAAYRKRIKKFEEDGRAIGTQNLVDIAELPELGDVDEKARKFIAPGLLKRDYDRLSVAYGLSEDVLNLAEQISGEDMEKVWRNVTMHRSPTNIIDAREDQRWDPNRMPYDD